MSLPYMIYVFCGFKLKRQLELNQNISTVQKEN